MAHGRHQQASGDEYTVRRYADSDLPGLRELDRAVWDRDRPAEWFEWKYAANPYLDHVPIFVAERDGEIVGARPFLAFRLRAGDETEIAIQPADTMVHPAHRRQGLFTRMTCRALEFYDDREPTLCFNFPNEQALAGYRNLGWRPVAPRRSFYRVQNPGTFLERALGDPVGPLLGAVATPVLRSAYALGGATARASSETALSVERRAGADPALLRELYERRPPDRIHARRDREFYDWWLASPAWSYTTYVARTRRGAPVAALLARSRTTDDGVRVRQLAEVQPLEGGGPRRDAIVATVARAIRDADDRDLFAAVGSSIPAEVLTRFGLLSGTRPPMKQLRGDNSTFAVRPIDDEAPDAWRLHGRDLTDRDEWLFTFCEHDTA